MVPHCPNLDHNVFAPSIWWGGFLLNIVGFVTFQILNVVINVLHRNPRYNHQVSLAIHGSIGVASFTALSMVVLNIHVLVGLMNDGSECMPHTSDEWENDDCANGFSNSKAIDGQYYCQEATLAGIVTRGCSGLWAAAAYCMFCFFQGRNTISEQDNGNAEADVPSDMWYELMELHNKSETVDRI